jgi:hypothetical protein
MRSRAFAVIFGVVAGAVTWRIVASLAAVSDLEGQPFIIGGGIVGIVSHELLLIFGIFHSGPPYFGDLDEAEGAVDDSELRPESDDYGPVVRVVTRSDDWATIWVPGAGAGPVTDRVSEYFGLGGYRLVSGTAEEGTYGKGSASGRLVLGVLAERYKFDFEVGSRGTGSTVGVAKGMSGISGGTIGREKMRAEFERVVAGLCRALGSEVHQAEPRTRPSIRRRLAELEDLWTSGTVTPDEYAAARARLLSEL